MWPCLAVGERRFVSELNENSRHQTLDHQIRSPPPDTRGVAMEGEPLPVNGKVKFDPNKPGFGIELKRELLAPFKG